MVYNSKAMGLRTCVENHQCGQSKSKAPFSVWHHARSPNNNSISNNRLEINIRERLAIITKDPHSDCARPVHNGCNMRDNSQSFPAVCEYRVIRCTKKYFDVHGSDVENRRDSKRLGNKENHGEDH